MLLLVSEGAWLSLAVDAFANGTAGPHRPGLDLPYLAFVVPGVIALLVASVGHGAPSSSRSAMRRWTRRLLVAAVVVVGVAVSAGVVAGLSAPGATWTVAFHPWALPGHDLVAQRAARWAWAVAVLGWARGVWVGTSRPTLRQSVTSLLLGAAVFVLLFAHLAGGGSTALRRATGASGWLLFVYFPVGVSAAAWAHEREVERRALRASGTMPSGAWVVVLTLPFAFVALVALLVGGAAGVVGPAAVRVVHAIGAVLGAVGDWVFSHLPQIAVPKGRARKFTLPKTRLGHHHAPAASSHPSALGIALLCVLGLLLLAVLAVCVRALVGWVRRARRASDTEVNEERESVFSWGHLGDQMKRAFLALCRWIGRLFRRRSAAGGGPASAPSSDPGSVEGDPVRSAYRRLLLAARAADHSRAPDETPRELARRLASMPELERLGAPELGSVTAVYERVRYADADAEPFAAQAAFDVDVIARALSAAGAAEAGATRGAGGEREG